MELMLQMSSMPWVCGNFKTTDCTARAYVTVRFRHPVRTVFSKTTKACLEKCRINFRESEAGDERICSVEYKAWWIEEHYFFCI
jgi:hypothetical protein